MLRSLFETQRGACRAQAERLTAVAGRVGRGLEVGSYVGGFLAAARDAGWMFEGVDLCEQAAAFTSRNGFKVTRGEISNVGRRSFDVVAIWNTFEQLYDTRSVLRAARRLLRGDGILVVRIPNGGFYAKWRSLLRRRGPLSAIAATALAHNGLLSFPYRQGFTKSSLTALLRDSRLRVVHVFGDTLVPIADQWTTRFGTLEERLVKRLQRLSQGGWRAPWVEVYARADPKNA